MAAPCTGWAAGILLPPEFFGSWLALLPCLAWQLRGQGARLRVRGAGPAPGPCFGPGAGQTPLLWGLGDAGAFPFPPRAPCCPPTLTLPCPASPSLLQSLHPPSSHFCTSSPGQGAAQKDPGARPALGNLALAPLCVLSPQFLPASPSTPRTAEVRVPFCLQNPSTVFLSSLFISFSSPSWHWQRLWMASQELCLPITSGLKCLSLSNAKQKQAGLSCIPFFFLFFLLLLPSVLNLFPCLAAFNLHFLTPSRLQPLPLPRACRGELGRLRGG